MKVSAPALSNPLPYCINFLIVLICAIGEEEYFFPYFGAWWTVSIIFVVLPLLDWFIEFEDLNPADKAEIDSLASIKAFRYITWVWAPVQLAMIFSSLYSATDIFYNHGFTTFLGILLSTGIGTGAIGITIAHELIHKNSQWETFLGKIILATCCYGHWYAAHLLGHHKLVGLAQDPSTAQKGESLWRFLLRNMISEFPLAISLERKRLEQQKTPFLSWENSLLTIWAITFALIVVVYKYFGLFGVFFFFAQSLVATSLLSAVNYIEHYGMVRTPGEPITAHHSWNSKLNLSNFCLFKLQRHGDHHMHGKRRYQSLTSIHDAPQHPYGYPAMLVLAMIPPLWFRIMDPYLKPKSN